MTIQLDNDPEQSEPAVGGHGFRLRRSLLAIAAVLLVLAPAKAQAPVDECDRLAAQPDDPAKVADGVDFDDLDAEQAISACRNAIRDNGSSPRFLYQLGRAYEKSGDVSQAVEHYRVAAERDYAMAANNLGLLYAEGKVPDVSEADAKREAERLLRIAADAGIAISQVQLAFRMSQGLGVRKDIHQAKALLTPLAESGNPRAQGALGALYMSNEQFPNHNARAVHWFERAAAQEYSAAQYSLALYLISGVGTAKDVDRAARLLESAVVQGQTEAQSLLGRLLLYGDLVEADRERAFQLLEDAAVKGDAEAQKTLKLIYGGISAMQVFGAPIPTYTDPPPEGFEELAKSAYGRNSLQMMAYIRRMAGAGYGWAFANLAIFYEYGYNVPKDPERAAELHKRARELGYDLDKERGYTDGTNN